MRTHIILFLTLIQIFNIQGKFSDHLSFVLYNTSWLDYTLINASTPEKLLDQSNFDPSKKTVLFVPGAPTPLDTPVICGIIDLYISNGNYNVITLYHLYYTNDPRKSLNFVIPIGQAFGESLTKLISHGLNVDSIELVGHSLGGHIISVIANYTTPQLPLSVSLDPANIVYLFDKGYTKFTIALWTNSGAVSQTEWNGDVNFVANNGMTQPFCKNLAGMVKYLRCHHLVALEYWGYIIWQPNLFYGIACNETGCNPDDIIQLGPNIRNKGTYYFRTSDEEPFGLGNQGIKNIQPARNDTRYKYQDIFRAMYYKIKVFQ